MVSDEEYRARLRNSQVWRERSTLFNHIAWASPMFGLVLMIGGEKLYGTLFAIPCVAAIVAGIWARKRELNEIFGR